MEVAAAEEGERRQEQQSAGGFHRGDSGAGAGAMSTTLPIPLGEPWGRQSGIRPDHSREFGQAGQGEGGGRNRKVTYLALLC